MPRPLPDQLHRIATPLIAARHRAGLSQRALGAKVGLAQSHISKIERAAVDPQVSNLVEIARALGLELMLIPTQLVPGVQALQRAAVPDPRRMPAAIDHDLTRLARHARELMTRFPELRVLSDIASAADELRVARLDESSSSEARSSIDAAEAILDRLRGHPRDRPTIEQTAAGKSAAEALAPIARTMRTLRNEWIHRDTDSRQPAAYRLDDSNA
jgi:transcriptional regulator with XRE-family HTH domain